MQVRLHPELDWFVQKVPIWTENGIRLKDKFALMREGVFPLGIVGQNYRVYQNDEIYSLAQEASNRMFNKGIENVEVYRGGKVIVLQTMIDDFGVISNDRFSLWFTIVHRHGGGADKIGFSAVRIFCANMLALMWKDTPTAFVHRLIHVGDLDKNLDRIKGAFTILSDTQKAYQKMSKTYVSVDKASTLLEKHFGPKIRGEIIINFMLETRTVWGLYNAVTRYLSHQSSRVSMDASQANEAKIDNLIGKQANKNEKVLAMLMKYSNAICNETT